MRQAGDIWTLSSYWWRPGQISTPGGKGERRPSAGNINICNVRSYRAKTPLDLARDRGHYQVIRYLQYILQKRYNPNVTRERRRQDQIKLPEFVIEEVAEEEEVDETTDEVIQDRKEENDCYIQELEIYLESLNIKLKQVLEEKEREVQ